MTARAKQATPPMSAPAARGSGCLVAGVGASAGGLASFSRLLRALPAHPGLALVFVQHLDPSHESMLTELLQRETEMPVVEVVDRMRVDSDHVYVMPPNVTMQISGGALKLSPRRSSHENSLPIDCYFRSLAKDCESGAVGVVLSGTGADGSSGLAAIREAGGLAFVQDPQSAEYDGMPSAAIAAGAADAVLDPEHIAEQLVAVARRAHTGLGAPAEADQDDEASLSAIIRLVRAAHGLDLAHYRRTTLHRRITRRMRLRGFETLRGYASELQGDSAELDALYRDVLVNVTEFFRDADALVALRSEAYPSILDRKGPDGTFRLWVPGCSRGQEAYSILMSLVEFFDGVGVHPEIQMFASDVNEADVRYARAGVYPETIAREVSPDRLAGFFTQVPGGYRIDQALREMCVFSVHDITRDPPFSKLDLVSFRNVLIYMERPLQQRVLQTLHYALEPSGFLLLGSSETTGAASSFFSVADKKHRLYVRKPGPARLLPRAQELYQPTSPPSSSVELAPAFDPIQAADEVVLGAYAPASLLVNDALDVLQLRGPVSGFLDPAEGPPGSALTQMVAPAVAAGAHAAVREAAKTGLAARRSGQFAARDGRRLGLAIEATPISSANGERYFLLVFEAIPETKDTQLSETIERNAGLGESDQVAALRRELDETRESVEIVLSEKEAANADLRLVGERLQTSNEELRTINEEYQTAQEELQSTNEELTTLNDELRSRNTELNVLTDDLDNVIDGVEIPILILGADLAIHRFTPQADEIVRIMPSDVGRPVTDLTFEVDVPDFKGTVENVLRTLTPSEADVRTTDGHWYSMRVRPYHTAQGRYDGVVAAFVDIDLAKRATLLAEAARAHAEALIKTVREPLLTLDSGLCILEANQAFYETFDVAAEETLGSLVYELGDGQWDVPELRTLLEEILPGDKEFADLEIDHVFPSIGRRVMVLGARRVREEHGLPSILLAIDDVTQPRRRERMDAALNDINLSIGSTFDLEDVLDEVLSEAACAVSADSAAVLLRQDSGWLIKSGFGMDEAVLGQVLAEDQVPLSLFSAECADPVLVADVSTDSRFKGSVGADLGHHCVLMVPLIVRNETIGSVSFHHLSGAGTFDDLDLRFVKRLGMLLSLAFENAQLYSAQRQIATTLQTGLLTPPKKIPGVEFGYLYRSATTAASVGGDLYDVFELRENRVGIVIGDVSGKGIEAATLAGVVKNTIRALAIESESPADIIAKTNTVLVRGTPTSIFVTLLMGVLDTTTGDLVYCSAGHTPGIVRRRESDLVVLEQRSPIVGAFSDAEFVNEQIVLARGDTLVLYTDGVTESRYAGKFLGQDGLLKIVRSHSGVSTKRLPKVIFADVLEYAHEHLADDIAIVCVGLAE